MESRDAPRRTGAPWRSAAPWLPVLAWMAVIFWLSSIPDLRALDVLDRAAAWLAGAGWPAPLRWLDRLGLLSPALARAPGTPAHLAEVVLRKGAHVAAYAVLALLARRAAARTPATAARPALWAAAVAVLYAGSDELHQAAVLDRDGRLSDVGIDAAGALLALATAARAARRPRPRSRRLRDARDGGPAS